MAWRLENYLGNTGRNPLITFYANRDSNTFCHVLRSFHGTPFRTEQKPRGLTHSVPSWSQSLPALPALFLR